MRKKLFLALTSITLVTIVYLGCSSNESPYVDNSAYYKVWDTQPIASVTVDTLYSIDIPVHQGGLLFTGLTEDRRLALAEMPLYQKRDISFFGKMMGIGFQHGNYAAVATPNGDYCVTSKHLLKESMSRVRDYGWIPDSSNDVMIKPIKEKDAGMGPIGYFMDASTSLNQRQVEVSGYRVFANTDYILYFRIRGVVSKVDKSILQSSRPLEVGGANANVFSSGDNQYMLRLPLTLQKDVMGLSGSGVYLVGIDGKVTDTLVGVQSARIGAALQNEETGEINITHLGITFEKM